METSVESKIPVKMTSNNVCEDCKNLVEADINPLFKQVKKVKHCSKGISISFKNCTSFESNN